MGRMVVPRLDLRQHRKKPWRNQGVLSTMAKLDAAPVKKGFIMSAIESRLAELGVTLPQATAPAANYAPFVRSGALLFTVNAATAALVKFTEKPENGRYVVLRKKPALTITVYR